MTAQELNTYIDKVLGNSIRCLLPSYWWKRLLTQIVEYVDRVDTKFDNKVKTLDNKINTNVSNLETEKQDVLISGTSIKTINGESILGSGDIVINSSSEETTITDGVYAVDANGKLINYNTADSSCLGVALIAGDHLFMIAKSDATDGTNTTLYWGKNLYQKDVAGITNISSGADYIGEGKKYGTDFTTWSTGPVVDFNGAANTAAIIAGYTEHGVSMDARDMCTVLNTFNASDSYNDWYVPACGQLALMYLAKTDINAALAKIGGTALESSRYWSSSEYDADLAWAVNFNNGYVYGSGKNLSYRVRFVRDISIPKSLKERVSDLESNKQDKLVSGTNIKTINGVSILGSGDIEILSESGGITSETDPIFTASAAANITTADITNWNSKTSNSGTITEVKANGTSIATSGSANIPAASTSVYGVTKLSSSTSSTSESLAATPKAVKAAYDLAASKTSNIGTITGITMNGVSKGTSGVVDLGNVITDVSNKVDKSSLATVATSGSYNDLSNKPTIPSEITETTVSGWGFTKNTGTITEIKMNDSSKGTSGVVDLGTVLTSHLDISGKLDKTEASNTYVTKQELILNIDPYNTDGIYAVTQDGDLVSYDRANESCIGVALVKGDHKFMIAKDNLQNTRTTFLWSYTTVDTEIPNHTTVDGINANGSFFDPNTTQLSTDYTTWLDGALSDFNGKENSKILISNSSRDTEMGYALKRFNKGSTTSNNFKFDDWYIPALGLLALMRIYLDEINEFFVKIGGSTFSDGYWSSSENSSSYAYVASFNTSSSFGESNKDIFYRNVRLIRDIIKEPLSKTSLLINDSNYIVDYGMFPDGVYAVTNTLNLVSRENADESCIGVAFIQGEHRYMISKYDSEESYWGYNLNIDIPDITNYDTTEEAELDFNGYNNTKAILNAYITYDKTIHEKDMCYFLNAFNVKSESQLFDDWYIPAYGLWHLMLPFLTEINAVFNKINGDFLKNLYLTSTERNASTSHIYSEFIGGWSSPGKQYLRYVRFIRDLRSIKEELDQQTLSISADIKSIREELDQQTLSISTLQDSVTILQDNLYKPLITLNSNKAHLLPNKYYRVNTTHYSSLTITLEPESNPNILNEYFIEFAIGSSNITISLPTNIKWVNGEIPLFFTDTTYLISIVNNLGIVTSFK